MIYKDNNKPKSIVKAIYLTLPDKIPQSYVSFCFLLKFIENHKILGPGNNQEKKSLTRKIPTRENFGPTKYPREKILNPRNTQEKEFETHEIPMRKYSEPTKYPQKNFSDPRRHDGTMARDPRWHETNGI